MRIGGPGWSRVREKVYAKTGRSRAAVLQIRHQYKRFLAGEDIRNANLTFLFAAYRVNRSQFGNTQQPIHQPIHHSFRRSYAFSEVQRILDLYSQGGQDRLVKQQLAQELNRTEFAQAKLYRNYLRFLSGNTYNISHYTRSLFSQYQKLQNAGSDATLPSTRVATNQNVSTPMVNQKATGGNQETASLLDIDEAFETLKEKMAAYILCEVEKRVGEVKRQNARLIDEVAQLQKEKEGARPGTFSSFFAKAKLYRNQ